MPLFRTHLKFNILLALPLWLFFLYTFFAFSKNSLAVFSASFLYASYFFHPDLDLAHQIKLFSTKGILTLPFRFYSLFFKHRGISHHPLWGTLTRIAWVVGFLAVIRYCFFQKSTSSIFSGFIHKNSAVIPFIVLGFFFSDLSHIGLDFAFSRRRKK